MDNQNKQTSALFRFIFLLQILTAILLFSTGAQGQDVYFSQHYANKPLVNPALTGMRPCPTVSTTYKNQWPELNNAFITYAAGYDQYFEALHGGIGLYLMKDDLGNGAINTLSATANYAYRTRLNEQWNMTMSLGGTYYQRSYTPSEMIFPDMVNSGAGASLDASAVMEKGNKNAFDFSAGMLLYSKEFYAGVAAFHIPAGQKELLNSETVNLPLRMNGHIGGNFDLSNHSDHTLELSPSAILQVQEKFSRLSTGLYFKWSILTIGAWYHQNLQFNPQFYTVMAGFVYNNMQIAYSNDFLIAPLQKKIMPSHEVSLILKLKCIKKKKKWEAISCPDF